MLGIRILLSFYLSLSAFYLLPLFIFSTQLALLGKRMPSFISSLFHLLFIVFLFSLYIGIKKLKKIGLWLAFLFHTLFLINSLLMFFNKAAILNIEGQKQGIYLFKEPVIIMSIIINSIALCYLASHKNYFH
jgi:hypothetical protein